MAHCDDGTGGTTLPDELYPHINFSCKIMLA